MSYHTPETKEQSKKWFKKGSPGPIQCKIQASRVKQMVLAFHEREGLIYTNHQCPQSVFEEDEAEKAVGGVMLGGDRDEDSGWY